MLIKEFTNVDYICPHCNTTQISFARWTTASIKDVFNIQTKDIDEAVETIRAEEEGNVCPNCNESITIPNDLMP
jgi:RNA polymerase subunit RPABC4/transcription elongation factor Spt4